MIATLLASFSARERWINEAIDRTVATTSHDVKNRIASLDAILTRYELHVRKHPALSNINNDFKRCLAHANEFMTRVQERLGTVVVNRSSFDLVALLKRCLRDVIPKRNATFDANRDSLMVEWDTVLIETAIVEVLRNALEIGGGKSNISLTVGVCPDTNDRATDRPTVKIECADNGPGVEDELKTRIFQPFFSRRPGQQTGRGLGLSFVRKVAEAHGGIVTEQGVYGQGARILFCMPLVTSTEEETNDVSCTCC